MLRLRVLRHFQTIRRSAMKRPSILAVILALLLTMGVIAFSDNIVGQIKAQQTSDVERVSVASQVFVSAIAARDIDAMDKIWAHEPYATFIGPLSTTAVVGWEGVRKAWQMRFGQFDRVTISLADSHVRANGDVAWVVGMEKVQLLRKTGDTLSFDAFVTNVFEKRDSRWLMVSHHATPVFKEAK
jgi:ketosteroid isomerase-like protein